MERTNSIKAWSPDERPREKLAHLGPSALDNAELMALFISTGIRGRSAIEIGRTLARNNPGAELIEVRGGSHMLPITHAELLADRRVTDVQPPLGAYVAAAPLAVSVAAWR